MKRSRLALFLVLGGALLPGAPPGRAQPPGVSVGKITVHGGQAVYDVTDGVLLDRGCAPDSSVKPFAAALGDGVELDVVLIACPPGELLPARCRLEIGENLFPWIVAQGAQVKIPVPLPDLTGTYYPVLHCEAGGQELLPALTSTLYLTYARPRPIVDPPREVWYERACSWGAGFGRSATEREVADTILAGLYQVGQRRWRYGTCSIQGSSCVLGKTAVKPDPMRLHCNVTDHLCKCPWTGLVAKHGPPCDFSDCFVFSQVLQYVGATMGIGGMVPLQVFGSYHKGFATHPKTRSLDPEFTGNLMCGERQAPCNYIFLNHSLRRWGDLFYDATFGNVYDDVGELYFQNVTQVCGNNNLIFENGAAVLLGPGFGGLSRYSERTALTDCADAPAPTPEGLALRSDDLFQGKNPARLVELLDLAWVTDQRQTVLRATIRTQVDITALYGLDARLSRGEKTIAYGGWRRSLDEGTTSVNVDFAFAQPPLEGQTYVLALSLHWEDPPSQTSPPSPSPLGGLMTSVEIPRPP